MQPSTAHRRLATISLLLALALVAGCSDATSPPGPTGPSIQVSVTTTGADLDPDGYILGITSNAGSKDERTTTRSLGVNETVVVSDVPGGEQLVWLDGLAANCKVRYPGPELSIARIAPGPAQSPPRLAISVTCVTRSIPPALAATQLFFVRGGQNYRTRADGTGLVALGPKLGPSDYAVWSPDGQSIAIQRDLQIYRARADGSDLVALGSGEQPAWSPDGQRIAFMRDGGIYIMDANGANVQRVATNPGGYYAPFWLPDGRRLMVRSGDVEAGTGQITVVTLDGATPPLLMPLPPNSWGHVWSPDGSRIAFTAGEWTGLVAVWTAASDGSDLRRLNNQYSGGLAWSPDGKQIAVSDRVAGIAVMNADGSGLRVLTSIGGYSVTWSPDGQAIAFDTGDLGCGRSCTPSVFYVTADGRTTGLLIENARLAQWRK
jgi:hypothetical protein